MRGVRGFFESFVFKELLVTNMFSLGWGEGGKAWKWRRRLMAWRRNWQGSAGLYFLMYLSRIIFQMNVSDFLIREMSILLVVTPQFPVLKISLNNHIKSEYFSKECHISS